MLERIAGKEEVSDDRTVAIAAALLANYQEGRALVRCLKIAVEGDAELERIAASLELSGAADEGMLLKLRNRNLAELLRIVSLGASAGSNVENSLSLFRDRLEKEIRLKNRFRAKVGSSTVLTYMGMGVFFPLFSGISSVILESAAGGTGYGAFIRGFLMIAMLYPPIILYLSSAFSHPERRAYQNLLSILPYFALASAITLLTRSYLAVML